MKTTGLFRTHLIGTLQLVLVARTRLGGEETERVLVGAADPHRLNDFVRG